MTAHLREAWGRRIEATSWRALDPDEGSGPWHDHDAVILPEHGSTGRRRSYTLHTFGQPISTHHSLSEAKGRLEETYGPLPWRHVRKEPLEVVHKTLGPTKEFSDANHYWAVDHLPKL